MSPEAGSSGASGRGVDPQQRHGSCSFTQSQSPRSAASSHWVETPWPDSCCLSQRPDHRSDGDRTSDPERRHPPSASQDQANLQHDIDRRRHCSPDDGGVYGLVEDSVAGHGQNNDVAQPPRECYRIRASAPTTRATAPEPQTRPHRAGPHQRPEPRQRQCPQSRSDPAVEG